MAFAHPNCPINRPHFRKNPKPETVVRIPLPNGQFAYLCWLYGTRDWLYDFLTNKPLRSPQYFFHTSWKYLIWSGRLTSDMVDVCQMPGISEYFDPRKVFRLRSAEEIKEDPLRPYWIPDPAGISKKFGGVDVPATSEEVIGFAQRQYGPGY